MTKNLAVYNRDGEWGINIIGIADEISSMLDKSGRNMNEFDNVWFMREGMLNCEQNMECNEPPGQSNLAALDLAILLAWATQTDMSPINPTKEKMRWRKNPLFQSESGNRPPSGSKTFRNRWLDQRRCTLWKTSRMMKWVRWTSSFRPILRLSNLNRRESSKGAGKIIHERSLNNKMRSKGKRLVGEAPPKDSPDSQMWKTLRWNDPTGLARANLCACWSSNVVAAA